MLSAARHAWGPTRAALLLPALHGATSNGLSNFAASLSAVGAEEYSPPLNQGNTMQTRHCNHSHCTPGCACDTCRVEASSMSTSSIGSKVWVGVGAAQHSHTTVGVCSQPAFARAAGVVEAPRWTSGTRPYSSRIAAHSSNGVLHSSGATCGCVQCSFQRASGQSRGSFRGYSTIEKYQEEIDNINDKFVEARDEIETARDDAETTYFNESYLEAQTATNEVLTQYAAVLGQLSDSERAKLQRSMGLKIEQLKAEFSLLDTLHD